MNTAPAVERDPWRSHGSEEAVRVGFFQTREESIISLLLTRIFGERFCTPEAVEASLGVEYGRVAKKYIETKLEELCRNTPLLWKLQASKAWIFPKPPAGASAQGLAEQYPDRFVLNPHGHGFSSMASSTTHSTDGWLAWHRVCGGQAVVNDLKVLEVAWLFLVAAEGVGRAIFPAGEILRTNTLVDENTAPACFVYVATEERVKGKPSKLIINV